MTQVRRALVTGATGFVGSNLVRKLVADGWDVHVIVRPNSKLEPLANVMKQITVHRHLGSTEDMLSIIGIAKPDVVFHLASLFLAQHTSKDIERLISSNLLFATQLVEAMALKGICNFVNTGTSWQHYENKEYSPVNLYAATKKAFEDILRYYVEAKGISAITLKLFDTYGPNDPRSKLFHLLEKIALEHTSLAMSPGEQIIDLVHVSDVVAAFEMAAIRLMTDLVDGHEEYVVSSGNPMSLRSVVNAFENTVGKRLSIEWGGRPYRTREVMKLWDKGKVLPGWIPAFSLEAGMADSLTGKEIYESKN